MGVRNSVGKSGLGEYVFGNVLYARVAVLGAVYVVDQVIVSMYTY